MTTKRKGVLWEIRDDRTLSEHAKIAYLMLWSRGEDIRPSMRTLAGDMGVTTRTAHKAVRELEAAGLVKITTRRTAKGDPDTNSYRLLPVSGLGHARDAPPPCTEDMTPPAPGAPEDSNYKTESEGRKSLASRRAQPAATREISASQKIAFVREAVASVYVDDEDMSDGQALQLWYNLAEDRHPVKPVAYFMKIFSETPDLNTHLSMCDPGL